MNVFVTGGCGYTGSVLVNKLLNSNHKVTILDTQWFGNYLERSKNLKIIKGDIRNIKKFSLKKINAIIHLANIANDPSVELDPNLSWEVNVLALKDILEVCKRDKVKHFIFASSGSVYGVKKEKKVTEDLELVPISTYNKTKMIAEKVIQSYHKYLKYHIIRPATVCGISPRMRLDVTVNLFSFQALKNKEITVFGGKQIRPNIHIKDLTSIYLHFLKNKNIPSGTYNAGFENLKLIDIAKKVAKIIPCKIKVKKNFDIRSYRQNSDKLLKTGFKRKFSVEDAIFDIKNNYQIIKKLDINKSFTVKWLKRLIQKSKVK
tara:strand:+ start:444 stop:1397 length:954 start_codon:yes stop_codon:yes gene_type:complete